jgi:hypothetical protein
MESSSALAELAFEQSQRRLDKQERVLEELRARTAILLAASSLAASFLGKRPSAGQEGTVSPSWQPSLPHNHALGGLCVASA